MKKFSAIFMAFALLAAACSGDDPDAQPDDAPTTEATSDLAQPDADSDPGSSGDSASSEAGTTAGTADGAGSGTDADPGADRTDSETDTDPDGTDSEIDTDADGTGLKTDAEADGAASGTGADETTPSTGKPTSSYDPIRNIDLTPLPVDDDQVVIGKLPNGLTYYVRSNDSPGSQLEVRLVAKAGSVNDPDSAEGTAHYLEHMLFNGTERYPKNELEQTLRDIGASFGPDLNAYTSWDETVYQMSVLTFIPLAVETVFDVLAQWMSAATLNEEDVESERGIVYDEYLLRDSSGQGQVGLALNALYTANTPYEGKEVVGTPGGIRSMTVKTLRDFYDTWYRPSNMAIVAVGDMPTSELVALIERYLGDLEGRGPEPQRTPITVEPESETRVESAAFSGVGASRVSLDWSAPVWPQGTKDGERLLLMESIITQMLENRLVEEFTAGRLSQASEPSVGDFYVGEALRFFGTNFGGSDLVAGTTDFLSVVTGTAEHGFTQQEMDRAAETLRVGWDTQVANEPTWQDWNYAAIYTHHFLRGYYLAGAKDRREWHNNLLEQLTLKELNRHWKWLWERSGVIVVPYGETKQDIPSSEEITAAIEAVKPRRKSSSEEAVTMLMAAPAPVAPVSSVDLDILNSFRAHEWRFANGATVVHVDSDIARGHVDMSAVSLGGSSILEPDDIGLVSTAVSAVSASGLGDISAGQLRTYLDGSTASAGPWIGNIFEGISGVSSTDDIEDLFALLHLYHTEPQISPTGLNTALSQATESLGYAESYSPWILNFAYVDARYPNNPWYESLATQEQIDVANAESLLELYEKRFGDVDDLLVVVVGDIDRDVVGDLAARYVGTLPIGEPDTYIDRRSPHPKGVKKVEAPLVDPSGTGINIYYEHPIDVTPALTVTLDVLGSAIQEQLTKRVREELGETYNASATWSAYQTPESVVEVRLVATAAAQFIDDIYAEMIAVIDDVVKNGISQSDLAQAIAVVESDYALISNYDLIQVMLERRFNDDDDLLTSIRRHVELETVTAADVQALAAQLFGSDQRIEVFGVPA